MHSLDLATGDSRNSGCEAVCCIYNPKRCGLTILNSVRVLVTVQSILSILELIAIGWIMSYAYIVGRDPEHPLLKPNEGSKSSPGRILEGMSVGAVIGNILRLLALLYMIRSLKDINSSTVITSRGLCLCTTTFGFIFITLVVFFSNALLIQTGTKATGTGDWLTTHICLFLSVLLGLDMFFVLAFGHCVVEHYRRLGLRSNVVDLDGWAQRDNRKYAAAPTGESGI